MRAAASLSDQFVLFEVGQFTLALPASAVEGVGTVDASADPDGAVDLATELGADDSAVRTHIVRTRANGGAVELIVGSIHGARGVPAEDRFAIPVGSGEAVARAFAGLLKWNSRLVPVLDVAGLFGSANSALAEFPPSGWDDLPPIQTGLGKILAFPAADAQTATKPVHYGLNMSSIVEIAPVPNVHPVPLAESPVRGWIDWRGRPVLLRDLTEIADSARSRLAVLRSESTGEPFAVVLPGTMKLVSVNRPNRACESPPMPRAVAVHSWVEFRDEYLGLFRPA